jgi:protein-S-isoprenylcysteine O-methyltransferase Ste14
VRVFASVRSAVYAAAFVALWAWMALGVRGFDAELGGGLANWCRPVGGVLLVVGGGLALWCVGTFALLGRGTPAPFDPPRRFVAVGPYRFVRNPMYLGGLVMLAGFGLWHRSPAMVLFTLVGLLAAHLFVVFVEEPSLSERFGDSYADYRRTVHRWLPRRP